MNAQTATQMRQKLFAVIEVLIVYALMQTIILVLRSTDLINREVQKFGWSYIVASTCFVAIPALVIWLGRRNWADYGVSLRNWQTYLDIGVKAFLVRFIPDLFGRVGTSFLGLTGTPREIVLDIAWVIAVVVMIRVMNRHKPVASGRNNLILIAALLVLPIVMALTMKKLSVLIVSTIVWQFVLSGFGEEFAFRGYIQSRLNQAFGRPMRLLGVQFGLGLIVASLLFGLLHAFNTFDPTVGFASFAWDWAIGSALAGFFFGVIREKTGTLLAPGIAHGLPDAVGEPMKKMFDWMQNMG